MRTPERLVLCGGAPQGRKAGAQALALNLHGPAENLHLRISDIGEHLGWNVPDVLIDLLEVACYVYAADSATPRGGPTDAGLGRAWRRKLHFEIPVAVPKSGRPLRLCPPWSTPWGFCLTMSTDSSSGIFTIRRPCNDIWSFETPKQTRRMTSSCSQEGWIRWRALWKGWSSMEGRLLSSAIDHHRKSAPCKSIWCKILGKDLVRIVFFTFSSG